MTILLLLYQRRIPLPKTQAQKLADNIHDCGSPQTCETEVKVQEIYKLYIKSVYNTVMLIDIECYTKC